MGDCPFDWIAHSIAYSDGGIMEILGKSCEISPLIQSLTHYWQNYFAPAANLHIGNHIAEDIANCIPKDGQDDQNNDGY